MTIREPKYHNRLVNADGTLSRELVNMLLDLARSVQGVSPTDLSAIEARLTELEVIPAQLAAIRGENGIAVYGSPESGLVISLDSNENQILAGQIFGG